jgi:uncharacterized membrane protein (GlpM family)
VVKVKVNVSALSQSHWYEYVIRFVFGGSVTALAGVIAKRYGPEIGGLFLAFPAIFPAAATLIERHEEKKEGSKRGERAVLAAGLDAIGSTFGAIGLVAFAIVVWRRLPNSKPIIVLAFATLAWAVTSVAAWELWEILRKRSRIQRAHNSESSVPPATPARPITNRRVR